MLFHNFRAVIYGKNDISDTSSCKSLDLVIDHGLVAKLDERLWQSERLDQLIASC